MALCCFWRSPACLEGFWDARMWESPALEGSFSPCRSTRKVSPWRRLHAQSRDICAQPWDICKQEKGGKTLQQMRSVLGKLRFSSGNVFLPAASVAASGLCQCPAEEISCGELMVLAGGTGLPECGWVSWWLLSGA